MTSACDFRNVFHDVGRMKIKIVRIDDGSVLRLKGSSLGNQPMPDDLMKVGGLWVLPVEVEEVLRGHDAVADCAVVGRADDQGLTRPLAFVCLDEAAEQSDELIVALLKHCTGLLSGHKVPRWIEFVEDFPRTATGKVQRFRLREES